MLKCSSETYAETYAQVLTETYAAAAGSHTGTPPTANRTTRVAALSANPANPAAAAAPLPLLMLLQLQHLVPRLQMRLSRPAEQF
jgi:hypothetical protein